MNRLQDFLMEKPALASVVLVLLNVFIIVSVPIEWIDNEKVKDMAHSLVQLLLSISLLLLIFNRRWQADIGLTSKFSDLPKRWWLAVIPMSSIALLNVILLDFSLLEFSWLGLFLWSFVSGTTGVFEEVLLRGLCFYLFYRAWQHKPNALFKAALAQAVIFGLAHLFNLANGETIDVVAQVLYATLLGIGFAGLVAYTKNLWLPISIHALINGFSDLPRYFGDNIPSPEPSVETYAAAMVVIFVLATIPGIIMLFKSQRLQMS